MNKYKEIMDERREKYKQQPHHFKIWLLLIVFLYILSIILSNSGKYQSFGVELIVISTMLLADFFTGTLYFKGFNLLLAVLLAFVLSMIVTFLILFFIIKI